VYLGFAQGLDETTVTDAWISLIHREAAALGYEGRIRLAVTPVNLHQISQMPLTRVA
jgi:hypothetical protein